MLWGYISENYNPGEPIIAADIEIGMSEANRRQQFKTLTDNGKIKRFENGVYYIPKKSRLGGEVSLPPEVVIERKYILRNGEIQGYYSGYIFANQIGISTQMPFVSEIVTNEMGNPLRKIDLNGRKFVLRKSRTQITKENVKTLQILDLLKDIEIYCEMDKEDAKVLICKYIKDNGITKRDFDMYLSLFPDKVYKAIYEMEIGNVLT